MRDIKRLREEIRTLIENLSKIYLPWKEGKDRKLKEGRHKARVEKKNASEQLTLNTSVNTPASASEKAQDPENSTENATNIASVEDGTSLSNGLTEMETEAVHESPNHNTEIENDDESATTEDVNEATDFAQKVKEKVESDGEEREDIENEGSRAKRENQMDDSDMETSSMELETAHVTVNPLVACISEKEKKRNKVVGITPPKPLTKKVQYSASKLERCTSPYCLNKEEQFDEV